MKTWLIGEAPTAVTQEPFTGQSGRRLAKITELNLQEVFQCHNLLSEYPGPHPTGKGTSFPLLEAQSGARELVLSLRPDARLILVGTRVKKAFKIKEEVTILQWKSLFLFSRLAVPKDLMTAKFAIIPHPSHVNKWWNLEGAEDEVRSFMRTEAEEHTT